MLIDSHCHLNFDELKSRIDDVIHNARENDIHSMLNIATSKEEFDENLKLIQPYDFIYQAIGTHPHNAQNDHDFSTHNLIHYARQHKKIIAIGETGLDFHYNHSPKEQQEKQFRRHIAAARSLDLPVIIHTRDAEAETVKILKDECKKGRFDILIHCFTGTEAFAQECLSLGAYLSFSGILTFKSAKTIQKVAQEAPIDRILVETDAPYLAPVPYRGKINEPAYLKHTALQLANIRNISLSQVIENTTNNFYRLFKKIGK